MKYKERGGYSWRRLDALTIADYWWTIIPMGAILFALDVWYSMLGGKMTVFYGMVFLILTVEVFLHERIHILAYKGTVYEKRLSAKYWGKAFVKIRGSVEYRIFRKSCLAPLWIPFGLAILSGFLILGNAGWSGPLLVMASIISLAGSLDDLYWVWKTRKIGAHGRYFDRGRRLDVVWKKEG